tara:strand:+ start:5437 stop:6192 length:756 start_codon:yes stop_codon:yes gene_type:complete
MTDMAKVSVTFSQKISEQAYETSDYSLTIERSVPESMGEDGIIAEADNMFSQAKAEVLKQAGQDFDVSDTGVVMRKLKSAVSEPSGSAPSVAAPAPASNQQSGPTQRSVAAPPARPSASGGVMSGRVYKRTDKCVGKKAELDQAAFNILAFQANKWPDNTTVFEVKEYSDGSTDVAKNGNNFPNFSISSEALARIGITVARSHGIWIRAGDSNVPLTVWDQVGGQTEADAIKWDWMARRSELQEFAYSKDQ